jgi:hypothetical protein
MKRKRKKHKRPFDPILEDFVIILREIVSFDKNEINWLINKAKELKEQKNKNNFNMNKKTIYTDHFIYEPLNNEKTENQQDIYSVKCRTSTFEHGKLFLFNGLLGFVANNGNLKSTELKDISKTLDRLNELNFKTGSFYYR